MSAASGMAVLGQQLEADPDRATGLQLWPLHAVRRMLRATVREYVVHGARDDI
eukprot:SAG31_NODE_1463_length_8238_cov_3.389851_1_plen_53_part_00